MLEIIPAHYAVAYASTFVSTAAVSTCMCVPVSCSLTNDMTEVPLTHTEVYSFTRSGSIWRLGWVPTR